ncbi:MAG: helix-turn-helix transcriptional regulator [Oscillibacter sp.]|nr:helix-turn-helix transcriptional regulator [Oscillibacter sp.]
MEAQDTRLLSKLSLLIPENDYHAAMHECDQNASFYEHYHDYYEITFYLGDQEALYRKEATTYTVQKGDVIFCRMFESHIMDCAENEGHMRFCIGIEPRILGNYSKKRANLYQMFSEQNAHYPIMHLDMMQLQKYLRLIEEFRGLGSSPGEQVIASSLVHRMLGCLYCDMEMEMDQDTIRLQHVHLVGSILHYIEENLAEMISLQAIAKKYNYSITYISKLFKGVTGSSLVSYIIEKRIARAKQLMYENIEIMQIAERVGYRNYSNFYKAFKKATGVSPEEYRRRLAAY